MNLEELKRVFSSQGAGKIFVKKLSPNDNSKNQVYLGGNFEVLNILPVSDIYTDSSGDWKKDRFKASMEFSWIRADGSLCPAPNAQLILYPKYPEVRFSGFLKGCADAPSGILATRDPGRLLFMGVTREGKIAGFASADGDALTSEFNNLQGLDVQGVFLVLPLADERSNRLKLLEELLRIHRSGWIDAKRLDRTGQILPCVSSNCGGYTLEAELGIRPNGYSEPDYLGFELKQFGVKHFDRISGEVLTLMTPEPTGGFYTDKGIEYFIRTYGYEDKLGRPDRMNFGGIHKIDSRHTLTNLRLELIGFDTATSKIRNTDGSIALTDTNGNIAASWSFASLMKHWNRKHNQACYVPAMADVTGSRKYFYGNNVLIGEGTDFQLFLKQMAAGHIYYDPGIKLENISTRPVAKRRSQFRMKSANLLDLYHSSGLVDLLSPSLLI